MVTRRSDQPRSGCAINAGVEVIGDRWSLLALRDVMFGNRRHFRARWPPPHGRQQAGG
jgi:DNA-binding HxlR family transcriptional regulator